MAKARGLKRFWQRVKQYRQNRTFQNNDRNFYQEIGGDETKTYQQPYLRDIEQFWNTETNMDDQHGKTIRRTRIISKTGNSYRFTRDNSKKYQIGKRLAIREYMDYGSRNSPSFTTD